MQRYSDILATRRKVPKYPGKVMIKCSHLNARLVGLDEYLCEDAVVVDLHGDDRLVRLDLAQHVARTDLLALLKSERIKI